MARVTAEKRTVTTRDALRGGRLIFISHDTPGQETRIEVAPHGPKILYHGPVQSQRWLDRDDEARAAYRQEITKHVFELADEHNVDEWEIVDEHEEVCAFGYR